MQEHQAIQGTLQGRTDLGQESHHKTDASVFPRLGQVDKLKGHQGGKGDGTGSKTQQSLDASAFGQLESTASHRSSRALLHFQLGLSDLQNQECHARGVDNQRKKHGPHTTNQRQGFAPISSNAVQIGCHTANGWTIFKPTRAWSSAEGIETVVGNANGGRDEGKQHGQSVHEGFNVLGDPVFLFSPSHNENKVQGQACSTQGHGQHEMFKEGTGCTRGPGSLWVVHKVDF